MLLRTMVLGKKSDKELEKQMQEDEVQWGQCCGEALAKQRLCGADWGEVLLWQRRQEMKQPNVGCVERGKVSVCPQLSEQGKAEAVEDLMTLQRENQAWKHKVQATDYRKLLTGTGRETRWSVKECL